MTGLIASVVEAFGELRVNKGRIMLSLIGVAVSVFALTAVTGGGGMLSSALEQSVETYAGRPAVLTVMPQDTGAGTTLAERDEAVLAEVERLGIEQRSRLTYLETRFQSPSGTLRTTVQAVDPAYAEMFRIRPEQGRWFADSDEHRLAPVVVVNRSMWEQLGRPEVGGGVVTLYDETGADSGDVLLIGVLADPGYEEDPLMYTPAGSVTELPGVEESALTTEYRVWVPPDQADAIQSRLGQALEDSPAGTYDVFYDAVSLENSGFGALRNAVLAVAGVILLLGALGLVNISLVTVRYRVREIGIRRSYGATGSRIFLGVLMESVVATVVAGAVGVAAAVALVRAPFTQDAFRSMGLVDIPPFPLSAVLIGFLAAIAVGVLAGALPALIATRITVIDAIRS